MSKRENDLVIELGKIVCKKDDFNLIEFFGFVRMQKKEILGNRIIKLQNDIYL